MERNESTDFNSRRRSEENSQNDKLCRDWSVEVVNKQGIYLPPLF